MFLNILRISASNVPKMFLIKHNSILQNHLQPASQPANQSKNSCAQAYSPRLTTGSPSRQPASPKIDYGTGMVITVVSRPTRPVGHTKPVTINVAARSLRSLAATRIAGPPSVCVDHGSIASHALGDCR